MNRREFCKLALGGLAAITLVGAGCEPTPGPEIEIPETQEDIADKALEAYGLNLPWINYGYDIGDYSGFSRSYNLEQNLDYLKSKNVNLVRAFFFCDFRSGLEQDSSGNIIGLNSCVNPNAQTLFDQANMRAMKVLPVLLDFHIANNVQYENGWKVGEYPDFFASKKGQFLEKVIRPFIRNFANHPAIYAWDIINEPKFASAVSKSNMKSFIQDCAGVIKQESPKPVCFGAHDPDSFHDYDNDYCDLAQVHHWTDWDFYNTRASDISGKPVLIGETAPSDVAAKLDAAFANGYQGLLFWRDDYYNFSPVADEFANWGISR